MKKYLLGLCALVLIFQSCKKVNDTTSNQDLLRGGNWHRGSGKVIVYSNGTTDTTDYWAAMPACVRDDYFTFDDGYNGTLYLAAMKCNQGDGASVPFHWELTNNGAGIEIYNADEYFPTGNAVNAKVLTLTSNTLKITYTTIQTNPLHSPTSDTSVYTDLYVKF